MIARRMADGIVELDATEPEVKLIVEALQTYAGDLSARSEVLNHDARHRRELADRFLRGRHSNRRIAGEREHEASIIASRADRAMDIVRVISGLDRPPKSQLPTPSQIEEGRHGDE